MRLCLSVHRHRQDQDWVAKWYSASPLHAGKSAAIVGSILGPALAIILWVSVTFSHREEKQMVLSGVVRHVTLTDITNNDSTLITSTTRPNVPSLPTPFASPAVKLPFDRASSPQSDISGQVEMTEVLRRDSVPVSDTASSLASVGRSASEAQGVGLLYAAHNIESPEPVGAVLLIASCFRQAQVVPQCQDCAVLFQCQGCAVLLLCHAKTSA